MLVGWGLTLGQFDKSLRLSVIDADKNLRVDLQSLPSVGMDVVLTEAAALQDADAAFTDRDVVVVNVETAAGLALVADIASRDDAPPIIAIGAKGFDRKPLEHVLLLAELRGAAAALPKPFDAAELAMAAMQVRRNHRMEVAQTYIVDEQGDQPQS